MIKILLPLLITIATPAVATSTTPYDELTNAQICSLIRIELDEAVRIGYIKKHEAEQVFNNCSKQ